LQLQINYEFRKLLSPMLAAPTHDIAVRPDHECVSLGSGISAYADAPKRICTWIRFNAVSTDCQPHFGPANVSQLQHFMHHGAGFAGTSNMHGAWTGFMRVPSPGPATPVIGDSDIRPASPSERAFRPHARNRL